MIAAGFGLLMLLASIDGSDADTEDRLLKLRFEAAVSEATRATQQRVAGHDELLGQLALQFNYLGSGAEKRFATELAGYQIRSRYPAVVRAGYLTLDANGRLQAHEFGPDARPVGTASVLARLSLSSLERPLAYSRDFNTLALSPVMPDSDSAGSREAGTATMGKGRAVMLVKPVYDNTTVGISRSSRRLQHRGWIYAMVDTQRLLAGIEQSALGPLDVSIYDGLSRQSERTLLFGTHRRFGPADARGLQSVRPVGLASRAWTQVVRLGQGDALPDAVPSDGVWLPRLVLALTGLAVLFWTRALWLRQRSHREDTRVF